MKKILLACLLATVFAGSADAQRPMKTYKDCMRACGEVSGDDARKALYETRLAELRAQQKAETDPQKLKQLAEDEENLTDKYEDEVEKRCNYICEVLE